MPLWWCDIRGCRKPAVRGLGDCPLCGCHLCGVHVDSEEHVCDKIEDKNERQKMIKDTEEKEMRALIATIDLQALAERATKVHRNIPCSIPAPEYHKDGLNPLLGKTNFHFEIHFEGGEIWMARVRRRGVMAPPRHIRDATILTEVATLMYTERTLLPTPLIYDYCMEGDPKNTVGVGFILMSKLPGKHADLSAMTTDQRRMTMYGLMPIYEELRNYRFEYMGSFDVPGRKRIASITHTNLSNVMRDELRITGPWGLSRKYYEDLMRFQMNTIVKREKTPERPVDAYLVHQFMVDLIPLLAQDDPVKREFFLQHGERMEDHLMIDESYNVVGITGWHAAYIAPEGSVFRSPRAFIDQSVYDTGDNTLSEDEECFAAMFELYGSWAIARLIRNSRIYIRFEDCLRHTWRDWEGFQSAFTGLRDAAGVDQGVAWNTWRPMALQRYENEYGLEALRIRERKGTERAPKPIT